MTVTLPDDPGEDRQGHGHQVVDGDAQGDGGGDVGRVHGDLLQVGGAGHPQGKEDVVQHIGSIEYTQGPGAGQQV